MTQLQAIVLGIVQGFTEFLPISSSAHLILIPWFFGWPDPGLAFDVFLHLGTLAAILVYFIGDWLRLLRAGIASILDRRIGFDRDRVLFWLLFFASFPAGFAGLFLHDFVAEQMRSPLLVAINLSVVGFLLYWVDGRYPSLKSIDEIGFKDAMFIGLAQALAIFPGVSRSGSTMTMARYLGMNRESAARFSFMLAFPITAAAGAYECRKLFRDGALTLPTGYLVGGFIASTICGLVAIHFLLAYVRSADFAIFAWYRMALAAVILICSVFLGM